MISPYSMDGLNLISCVIRKEINFGFDSGELDVGVYGRSIEFTATGNKMVDDLIIKATLALGKLPSELFINFYTWTRAFSSSIGKNPIYFKLNATHELKLYCVATDDTDFIRFS